MTKFIAIGSLKGGVGKTTVAINLAAALSKVGSDVILVDANLTTPNVSLHLGHPELNTIHDVITEKISLNEAIYKHTCGLRVMPSSIFLEDINVNHFQKLSQVLNSLKGYAETVIMDTVSGINEESINSYSLADEIIVVLEPNFPSTTEALKLITLSKKLNIPIKGFVLNKIKDSRHELSKSAIESLLGEPLIGIIPEDENMHRALAVQHPIVHSHPNSKSSYAFMKLAYNVASIPINNLIK